MGNKKKFYKSASVLLILFMLFCSASCSVFDNNKDINYLETIKAEPLPADDEIEITKANYGGEEYFLADYINENPVTEVESTDDKNRTLYKIDCILNNDDKTLSCVEKISYLNETGVTLNNISFHLYPEFYSKDGVYSDIIQEKIIDDKYADFKINKVTINDQEIKYIHEKEILKFDLPSALPNGETIDINIEFVLKMPQTTFRLTCTNDDYSVTNWYPIVCMYNRDTNTWDERAFHPYGESNFSYYNNYDVNITVPVDYVVVGTGIETVIFNDGVTKIYNLKEENVKDFVFFASKKYQIYTAEVDGIQINSYYKRNFEAAERVLRDVMSVMEFMNKAIGKYPFDELDIVESNIEGNNMEYPTVIQLGAYNDMLSSKPSEGNLTLIDRAVVHEMIHQWFYNVVGNDCYSEPLLDETITALWTGIYFTYEYGTINNSNALYNIYIKDFFEELLPINRAVNEYTYENEYFSSICELGWAVFEDVKLQVGDEKFIEVFRNYYNKYKFTNATIDNLLYEFENVCGSDIRDYLDKAINTKEYNTKKMYLFDNKELKTVKNGYKSSELLDLNYKEADEETKEIILECINDLFSNTNNDSSPNYYVANSTFNYVDDAILELRNADDFEYNVYDIIMAENNKYFFAYFRIVSDNKVTYSSFIFNEMMLINSGLY